MKKNKPINYTFLFFVFFFGSIISSVILTYYKVVVLKDFVTYKTEEEIPSPGEFYKKFLSR